MDRSSCGRLSCIRFIKSRNLVSVRAVVAICWRKLAMMDYTRQGRGRPQKAVGIPRLYLRIPKAPPRAACNELSLDHRFIAQLRVPPDLLGGNQKIRSGFSLQLIRSIPKK